MVKRFAAMLGDALTVVSSGVSAPRQALAPYALAHGTVQAEDKEARQGKAVIPTGYVINHNCGG